MHMVGGHKKKKKEFSSSFYQICMNARTMNTTNRNISFYTWGTFSSIFFLFFTICCVMEYYIRKYAECVVFSYKNITCTSERLHILYIEKHSHFSKVLNNIFPFLIYCQIIEEITQNGKLYLYTYSPTYNIGWLWIIQHFVFNKHLG